MGKATGARLILLLLLLATVGCGSKSVTVDTPNVLFIVPGVGGDGQWRHNLVNGLRDVGVTERVQVVGWGAPLPLFFLNFQTTSIHNAAERKLADRVAAYRARHTDAQITLLGHSAGAGVALGALGRLPADVRVRDVFLLAPSVSPGYDLGPALTRIEGRLHVFHSTNDTFFLKWRTGTFGTYDNVRTPAAGHLGFSQSHPQLVQHPYDPAWRKLGNDGGHFGTTGRRFAAMVLARLFREPRPRPAPATAPSAHLRAGDQPR